MLFRRAAKAQKAQQQQQQQQDTLIRLRELSSLMTNVSPIRVVDVLLRNVQDIILIIDEPEGVIHNASASFAAALRTAPSEFRGKKITQFIHPNDEIDFSMHNVTRWRQSNGTYVCIEWMMPIQIKERLFVFGKILGHVSDNAFHGMEAMA